MITLKKYILEDFLTKINKLTPNVNSKINYGFPKRKNFKVLMKQKNTFAKKGFNERKFNRIFNTFYNDILWWCN